MNNIPNRIKQPSQCCVHCGKIYKTKANLNKHIVLCDLIYSSKVTRNNDYEVPSQRRMYEILMELGQKYNRLEEKVNEINKLVIKKKKQINVVEWLNKNIVPNIYFEKIYEKIIILNEDIQFLLHNSFNDTLNNIFTRTIYNMNENETPIIAFIQKSNTIYIYDKVEINTSSNQVQVNTEYNWIEMPKESLIKFLNRIQTKISKAFQEWKKQNYQEIKNNDIFAILTDKTMIKIMSPLFKEDQTLNKVKSMMYNNMKTEIKTLIEYDFEF